MSIIPLINSATNACDFQSRINKKCKPFGYSTLLQRAVNATNGHRMMHWDLFCCAVVRDATTRSIIAMRIILLSQEAEVQQGEYDQTRQSVVPYCIQRLQILNTVDVFHPTRWLTSPYNSETWLKGTRCLLRGARKIIMDTWSSAFIYVCRRRHTNHPDFISKSVGP